MGKKIIILLAFFVLLPGPAGAQSVPQPPETGLAVDIGGRSSSGLPIPRFVSLASEKVFVRTGPALRYPIKWIYQREYLPVEIVQEFDTWRKIRDMDGDSGWVHQSLLSGDRSVIIKGEKLLAIRKDTSEEARILAYFEPAVIAAVRSCEDVWCEIEAQGYRGWTQRKFLWGIYEDEDFH